MAVGLGFLGRGRGRAAYGYGLIHILGAALAGGAIGALLGAIGQLLGLPDWRDWVLLASVALALVWARRALPPRLGANRQVPRRWAPGMPLASIYFIWGAMLGSGFYTPIYQSVFVVLVGGQLTAGWQLGLLSGVIFGAVRQSTALYPVQARLGPEQTMRLLERFRPLAERGNLIAIVIGGLGLVVIAVVSRGV